MAQMNGNPLFIAPHFCTNATLIQLWQINIVHQSFVPIQNEFPQCLKELSLFCNGIF
jgi:hypothetical protein